MADQAAKGKPTSGLKRRFYSVEGGRFQRLRTPCPKCGAGVYLANHADRASCGRCGYTEFKGRKA